MKSCLPLKLYVLRPGRTYISSTVCHLSLLIVYGNLHVTPRIQTPEVQMLSQKMNPEINSLFSWESSGIFILFLKNKVILHSIQLDSFLQPVGSPPAGQ